MATAVHQEVEFTVPPQQVFAALTDARIHAGYTGGASEFDATPGGVFVQHDGQITGRTLYVEANAVLVQAWRPEAWPAGVYSLVRYTFEATPTGTRLILDHTGIPEGAAEHLDAGWHQRYWTPLQAWFAG